MNIYDLTLPGLEDFFINAGENKAKAKLVFGELYRKRVVDFGKMQSFGEKTKALLSRFSEIKAPEIVNISKGEDTVKLLYCLEDCNTVEAVLMRHNYGNGLCVSTQVGCNMNCAFCESGRLKKVRNLKPSEMVAQLLSSEEALGVKITHITLMGIGEPLDNFENVMKFIDIIGSPVGLDIPPRRITISTCGLVPEIEQLMRQKTLANLAVSLHAPNNALRNKLMPVNKAYGLEKLIEAISSYSALKNRKSAIEYVMLKGINDSHECAHELAALLKGIKCYVNLIPYNKTENSVFERSSSDVVTEFCRILLASGIRTTIRREFGSGLGAACGQLRSSCDIHH